MPLEQTAAVQSLARVRVHHWASCWKIERVDGTIFRFTGHDQKLVLADGETYTPVGAVAVEATRRELDGGEHSTGAVGILSSDLIRAEDLIAGLYRGAKVTQYLVDWRFPWAGNLDAQTYWIQDVEFTGEVWVVQVAGLATVATRTAGTTYSRDCGADLGDARCTVVKASFTVSDSVLVVTDPQRAFTTGLLAADGYYNWGELIWTVGANAGLTSCVKVYESGEITLHIQTQYAIEAGDEFDVVAGCDKHPATCRDVFDNIVNFRGFPFIPGQDRTYDYPDVGVSDDKKARAIPQDEDPFRPPGTPPVF